MPNDWIKTASGKAFEFLDPDPASIELADICYALSYTYRFGGHSSPYSVASHSIAVGDYIYDIHGPYMALCGYLHDASEAYLGDMPTPIKKHLTMYQRIEQTVQNAINLKYIGRAVLSREVRDLVKLVDKRALAAEVPLLHGVECDRDWVIDDAPLPEYYIRGGNLSPEREGLALMQRILRARSELMGVGGDT